MKLCDFYFFGTLRNVFQKYHGRCFYQTLRNVSIIKKFQCLTETSNSTLSKKDLAIFREKINVKCFTLKCVNPNPNQFIERKKRKIHFQIFA